MSAGWGLEAWTDAVRTLVRHRARSSVTALSMSWGLFMLIVLLGAASGLARGSEHMLGDDAINSLWIYPGETSVPHRGTPTGRAILFDEDDLGALTAAIPEIEHISGRVHLRELTVTAGDRRAFFEIRAVHPEHAIVEPLMMTAGRFFNPTDMHERRKVAVIGREVASALFGVDAVQGRDIVLGGVHYRVVGSFDDLGGEGDERLIYLPISTAQLVHGLGRRTDQIMFTIGSHIDVEHSRRIAVQARRVLATRHGAAPDDLGAIRIDNGIEEAARIRGVIAGITAFTWIVGLGTVVAGVVGVSNIMLISVAERTREFGVRRALGASGGHIVAMVLRESLVLTIIAGYAGLLAGIAVLTWVAPLVPDSEVFRDPVAEPAAIAIANAVLLAAGLLAGIVPAHRATLVTPIEALRA